MACACNGASGPWPACSTTNSNDASREERLLDVIAAYVEARDQGQVSERGQWLARYPEFAAELADFFAARERLEDLAAPRRGVLARPAAGSPEAVVAPALPELGQLGDFHLLREIGRGGMGVVYEAEQISLGRCVALKVLPFVAALDPKQLQRFKNEAQAAAHLQHQNIVPVFYVGCERGVHFYAMQYIDGQTLAAVIREFRQWAGLEPASSAPAAQAASALASELASGRWVPVKPRDGHVVRSCAGEEATGPYMPTAPPPHHPDVKITTPPPLDITPPVAALSTERSTTSRAFFRTVAHLGVQAAEALEHAHQLGIIHRDIKPANLLVDAGGRLWVTDFGLAHCQSLPGLTMTGDLVGTLRYMSPEQALAKRVTWTPGPTSTRWA